MKKRTRKKLRALWGLLLVPVVLTGCRIRTTPMGVFAQILEYAGQNNSQASSSHGHGTYHTESQPSSTPIPQMDYDSLDAIGEVQTIMVYLVGSDLESDYGNASLDLDEMETAGVDTAHNNILVYAGGASEWQDRGMHRPAVDRHRFRPRGYLSGGKHGGSPDFEQLFKLRF